MLEKNLKKKVEEKISKFWIEIFFRAKKSQFSSKKTRFPPEIFDRKNILKIRKIIGKCVKKIENFGKFFQNFVIFFTPFRIFFVVYVVSFLNQKFRKFFEKI